jgi:hypothetical protein
MPADVVNGPFGYQTAAQMKSRPEFPPNGWSSPLLTPKNLFRRDLFAAAPSPWSDFQMPQPTGAGNVNPLLTLTNRNAVNNG